MVWQGRAAAPVVLSGGFGADKHELASVTSRLPWEADGEPAAGPWEPRVWCPRQPRLLSPSGLNWFRALGSSGVSSVFCQESKLPPHLGVAEWGPCTTWLCCRLCPEGRGESLQCLFAVVTQLSSKTHLFKNPTITPGFRGAQGEFFYGSCTFPCSSASRSGVLHGFRCGAGNRCC